MRFIRSVLFVPADQPQKIQKALGSSADCVIVDLEDAVSPDKKDEARRELGKYMGALGSPQPKLWVRINGVGTPWHADDVNAVSSWPLGGLVIPKVETQQDLEAFGTVSNDVWAMIETPVGLCNIEAIARHPRVCGLILGTSDLVRDLRARHMPRRQNLFYALSRVVTSARAFGKCVLDGVYLNYRDLSGFEEQCIQARDFGFDGKTLIHPNQIEMANRIFSPSEEEIQWANEVLSAWKQAVEIGKGVVSVRGILVEHLHITEAEATLKQAQLLGLIDGPCPAPQ
ncbi:MAG: CoA ester lyase [Deinococcaceae bacterium]